MKVLLAAAVLIFVSAFAPAQTSAQSPDARQWDWATASPESHGLSSNRLELFWADLKAHRSTALLVIRNDAIVFERYSGTNTAKTKHFSASMAKALVGGVSAAIALTDGKISLDDRASRFIPQWAGDATKSPITLRQLGSHTSGLSDAEESGMAHDKLSGWKGDFWKRLPAPNDPFTLARDKAPVLFAPGSNFQYSNPGLAMLGYAITAAIKDEPQKDLRTLLLHRVMRPIGVADGDWSIGYGQTVQIDGLPLVATWGGGNFTARSVARIGRLMLRKGNWQGQQLIVASAVEAVTRDAGTPKNCGIGWWSNNDGTVAKLPRDAFWGSGAGHQVLLVIPSLNLIAVRNGDALNPAKNYDDALREHFFEPLMLKIADAPSSIRAPVPPSPIIKGIEWAGSETIQRKARGSDNWPLTWGDDDAQYSAYGDGSGFEPFVEKKLSLGLAKILGGPDSFFGINIRSPSIEQIGDGKVGRKASGILMVESVLYLWARNAGNSQLAWSNDHGATWSWAEWKFEKSFGCSTFLNFGKNYDGARDDFVYIYSPDSDNAYDPADRFVLARVPKTEIRNRERYDFLDRLDEIGHPIWTKKLEERGAVFTNPGQCYRSGITYDAGLKRYLWCQILPGSTHPQGPRFQGGFGIYDAPEPWGPWTTVFFTDAWDVGPGESSSFPTKWMSADGKTVHLVFSGNDCFSVRKAVLITSSSDLQIQAEQGSAQAQYDLAFLFQDGTKVSQDFPTALKWLRKAAEQGFAPAQNELGIWYSEGKKVGTNYTEALNWYRKAAEQGLANSQNGLGLMYANGWGVPKNFDEAMRWFRLAADQGFAPAESNLGRQFALGEGVPKDFVRAADWYSKAAAHGDAVGLVSLGKLYFRGDGVSKDARKSEELWLKAADRGNHEAEFLLGGSYIVGDTLPLNPDRGVEFLRRAAEGGNAKGQEAYGNAQLEGGPMKPDPVEAEKWLLKAADQGEASAQFQLANLYTSGHGVAKDLEAAFQWCLKAAEQGHVMAQHNVAAMYFNGNGVAKNHFEAFQWYSKAALQGNADAQRVLGVMYSKGLGVARDEAKALEYTSKAADQGNGPAQWELGRIYYLGNGKPKDLAEAARWFKKAAEQGEAKAQFSLGYMYYSGDGLPQNHGTAAEWLTKGAQQGDSASQLLLGMMYAVGKGVKRDSVEAYKWLQLSADQGEKKANAYQDRIAKEMSFEEISRAMREAREFKKRPLENPTQTEE